MAIAGTILMLGGLIVGIMNVSKNQNRRLEMDLESNAPLGSFDRLTTEPNLHGLSQETEAVELDGRSIWIDFEHGGHPCPMA
jgi:hypothetical protein